MAITADGTYWKINGVKKLLVGGTWGGAPHLYEQQYSGNGITISDDTDLLGTELTKIANAGGNYFRCTLGASYETPYVTGGKVYDTVLPFTGTAGAFDLTTISTDWEDRVDALLYRAEALGIIVQLELFDTWWCTKNAWDQNLMWWNPDYVSTPANYTLANTGLPASQDTDNDTFTAPALAAADTNPLLIAQKLYVAAVCTIVKRHSNAFIQIQNESAESDAWENYWADYIAGQSVTAPVTSMKIDNGSHAMTDSRYDFGDNSQQQSTATNLDTEWGELIAFHTGTKPVNAVKVYSRWNSTWGYPYKAIDLMFLYFMGGNAACAFHPGTANTTTSSADGSAGLGTSNMALDAIRAARWLDNNCSIPIMGAVDLTSDKWGGSRPSQGAWACHGTHYIAIYVNSGSSFTFDTTGIGDTAYKKWYRIDGGSTNNEASETSSTTTSISNPFGNNRAIVIISGSGGDGDDGGGGTPPPVEPPPDTAPWIPPVAPIPKVWPFIPQRIHTEAMEWKTDVIRAKAIEELIALRAAPRHFYDYDYVMNERELSRAKIIVQDGEDVYLPIWGELTKVASVSSGVELLLFDTSYAHYTVDGQAIIWQDDDTFEVVTIDTVTPTGITWTGALESSYSLPFVMPVKTCKFTSALRATRYPVVYGETSVGFVTTETEDLSDSGGIVVPAGESLSITNHDAETGDITGWTKVSGNWTAENDWGLSPSGGYYFIPDRTGSADGVLRQTVSLVVGGITATIIDNGKAKIKLTWEQITSRGTSADDSYITLTFLNASSGVISSASSPNYHTAELTWETLNFETAIPSGARSVRIDLESYFSGEGLYNDTRFDNIRGQVYENASTIPDVVGDLMTDCNVLQSGTLQEAYFEEMDVLDYDTGDIWSDEAYRYPMRHSVFSWHTKTKEELWAVRTWLHNRRGRQSLFWLPSWNNDFEVTAAIDAADEFITIKDIGYADHVDIVRYAMITTTAGVRHHFRILAANNELTPGFETFYLGAAFGATLALADIAQGSIIDLMRLSADRVELKHIDAGQTTISVPLMDPIFNGGVIGSIAGTMPAMEGDATGWISLHATSDGVLPSVTGAATGNVVSWLGTIAGTLPAITGAATGTIVNFYSGAAAGNLPAVTGSVTGLISLHITSAGTLPAMTGSLTGWTSLHADGAGDLPTMTGSFTGWISLHSDVAGTLPAITGSATGTYTAP